MFLDISLRSEESREFEAALRNKIVGQGEAVQAIVDIFQVFRSGLAHPHHPVANLLFLGPTGVGKCLAEGTPVLMFDGTTKRVEDVAVGDLLMGPDSKLRRVRGLASGIDEMYEITPVKGESYTVNSGHILSLQMTNTGLKKGRKNPQHCGEIINIPVTEYLTKSKYWRHCAKGYRTGVEFAAQPIPVDPYLLGMWLGDGEARLSTFSITSADREIVQYLDDVAASTGMAVRKQGKTGCPSYYISTGRKSGQARANRNCVTTAFRSLGLHKNKHVPFVYKTNSREVRLQVLAGLMDTDGSLTLGNTYDFVQKSLVVATDTVFIARSLGLAAYMSPCQKADQNGTVGDYYRISISGNISEVPVRLPRKKARSRQQKKNVLRTGISVRSVGTGRYFGFELDGDGLFLLGDFTVTHNSRVVEAAAEILFDNARAVTKINCAEFQHSHEISKLIGSPPGYVGHSQTVPLITQRDLSTYHKENLQLSFLLFDEIEKASSALWQLLLGMLDKATLTLGDNSHVDLSKTIIFLTSNLGGKAITELMTGGMGFSQLPLATELEKKVGSAAQEAARQKFSPEFMNRLDKVVVFRPLQHDQLEEILEIELGYVQQRIADSFSGQILLHVSAPARAFLLREGTDLKYGARHLKRAIEKFVVYPLANLIATTQVKSGDILKIDYTSELTFEKDGEVPIVRIADS